MDEEKRKLSDTCTGRAPEPGHEAGSAPAPIDPATGQHGDHWILSDEERAKGFVRPVRLSYFHDKCGTVTTMPQKIAETYAAKPAFYGRTFCVGCKAYLPVGANGEFTWADGTKQKVGT